MLLCELHAHTTWSDGELTLPELVELYGEAGFDVLAVTDHVVARDDPWLDPGGGRVGVVESNHRAYLDEIDRAAGAARSRFGMLVFPGLELTLNHSDPDRAAHAVALGLRAFVGIDDGVETAMREARARGAALIAAHPHDAVAADPDRLTRWFWRNRERAAELADRFELFNRDELFGWVAAANLPAVASGDTHRRAHLPGWKTLLPCEQREDAVVAYLRSPRPAFVGRFGRAPRLEGWAAA